MNGEPLRPFKGRTHAVKPFRILPLLFAAVPALVLAQAPKWTPYTAKADRFSVLMPGAVQTQTQTVQGLQTHMFMSMAPSVVCILTRSGLPANTSATTIKAMGEGIKKGLLASSKATATADHPASYAGRAGRQIDFKLPNGGKGSMFIVQAPGVTYTMTVVKQAGAPTAEAAKFFNSFKAK